MTTQHDKRKTSYYVDTVTQEGLVRDYGVVGPEKCPHCDDEKIHAVEIRKNGILAWFNVGVKWSLRCPACNFHVELPSGETLDAIVRTELVHDYFAKKIGKDEFVKRLAQTTFPTLSAIEDDGDAWICDECGEAVPKNFYSCWKCNAHKSGEEITNDSEQIVTAAVIIKDDRVMIAKRAIGRHVGSWEFPGGKMESGETPEECLARELTEEFQVDSEIGDFVMESIYEYEYGVIRLLAYRATLLSDAVKPCVHDMIKWVKIDELTEFDLLPADVPIAEKLATLS